ncbi:glycyl-radical enzyme activating protein [Caproiciproducens sp. CPB-2]|uniref:glycyl-radical enzyme activating protein n=1 Tax=Caproiciproducens sp. CPB-2 TaxID=3030017 RepID=UPI003FA41FDA
MEQEGRIFDIRRFSVHDGDGIRTTVFFKGCPLRCRWCQNPEGISPDAHLFYFKNKCIGCFTCVSACPEHAISPVDEGGIKIDRTHCNLCMRCTDVCPARALAPDSELVTVREVVERIKADLPFFRYGGGVTISGGEPFSQFQFLRALLQALKKEEIHTTIETSLFTAPSRLQAVLPYLDMVFADVKVLNRETHRKATGVDNNGILENIRTLLTQAGPERIIRTPLIPAFTATEQNIEDIARFISGIDPEVRYELLNYNPLARGKYDLVEQKFCFAENPRPYTKAQMERFYEAARRGGVKNLVVDSVKTQHSF